MVFENLYLVYAGCFFAGLGQGLGQFYRFSAVEIAPVYFKSQAVTYVLSGGIIAAFLGPTTANYSIDLIGHDYFGSYLSMGIMGILNQIAVMQVSFPAISPQEREDTDQEPGLEDRLVPDRNEEEKEEKPLAHKSRPILEICSQPLFIVSCAVATIAHTQMVMVMSNCSLAMNDKYDYSFNDTARVMESHFFCMFAPGFFTGRLIEKFGTFLVAVLGAVVFALSSGVFLLGSDLWNFYMGMALLGIAWNFSFSSGTVMLTGSYRKSEATNVQAVNDFILFSVAGIGSLASGAIYSTEGWFVLIYVATCMMLFNFVLFSLAFTLKKVIDDAVENAEDSGTKKRVRDPTSPYNSPLNDTYNSLLGDVDEENLPQVSPQEVGRSNSRSSSKSYTEHFLLPTPTDYDIEGADSVRSISVA